MGSRLRAGKITRRDFIGTATSIGLGMAISASLADQALASASPRKGGTLKVAMGHGESGDILDPASLFNGYQWALNYAFRNTLTQIGPGNVVEPGLAISWEAIPGAKQWTFELRQGVEFSNGKSMTTEDVIASINHHRGEDSKSFVKPIANEIASIKTDGKNKIIFELVSGNADLPDMLASGGFSICPANADGSIDWQSHIGTGGYLLKEYEPGIRSYLLRNPNYWRDDRAFANDIEFLTIQDPVARENALKSGVVDVIDKVDLKTAAFLNRVENIHVEETTGPLHYCYPMMTNVAPFDNNDIRMAMKYAIDRELLLKTILNGHGSVGNDTPIGPSYQYHDASIEQRKYDPDKARFHLKKAGLSSIDVSISAADAAYAGAVDATVMFKETAKRGGININVVREPNDGYWSDVWMKKPVYADYWGGYTTESEMLATGYLPGAAWNETYFDHARFTEVLLAAKAELDPSKRRGMYSELQMILRDEGGNIVPLFANEVLARSDKVNHGALSSDRGMDGRHILERWWVV
ncbi:MAG: twin-arginine translocation signal domain-containing protein [Rhodospirillales bacterium]|nr:twin-arginine translocation signal domain-containing protein [Rhodospirillales bacterium]